MPIDPDVLAYDVDAVRHVLPKLYRPSGVLKQSRSLDAAADDGVGVDTAMSSRSSSSSTSTSSSDRRRGDGDGGMRGALWRSSARRSSVVGGAGSASRASARGMGTTRVTRGATAVTVASLRAAATRRRGGVGVESESVTTMRREDDDDDDDDDDENPSNSTQSDDDDGIIDDDAATDSGAAPAPSTSARGRRERAEASKHKPFGGKRATRLPDADDIAFAYASFDVKKRGFFSARDIRRVADANGFADWTDDDVRRMSAAFKPKRVRDAMSADDPTMFKLTRDEFSDVVRRSGARVGD